MPNDKSLHFGMEVNFLSQESVGVGDVLRLTRDDGTVELATITAREGAEFTFAEAGELQLSSDVQFNTGIAQGQDAGAIQIQAPTQPDRLLDLNAEYDQTERQLIAGLGVAREDLLPGRVSGDLQLQNTQFIERAVNLGEIRHRRFPLIDRTEVRRQESMRETFRLVYGVDPGMGKDSTAIVVLKVPKPEWEPETHQEGREGLLRTLLARQQTAPPTWHERITGDDLI